VPAPHDRDHRANRGDGGDKQQQQSGKSRDGIANRRNFFIATGPVRDETADEARQSGRALIQTINRAECQRRETKLEHQVGGQDAGHHLR
jgi:hypothetical protein